MERGKSREEKAKEYAQLSGIISKIIRESLSQSLAGLNGLRMQHIPLGDKMITESFSPSNNHVTLGAWFMEEGSQQAMTYHLNGTADVLKGGVIYDLSDEATIVIFDNNRQSKEGQTVKPMIRVDLEELRILAKIAENPAENKELLDKLKKLPLN